MDPSGRLSSPADGDRGRRSIRLGGPPSPSLDNKEAVEKAVIPGEKINGPVLLVSGKDDRLWPSSAMVDMVIAG
ncbi:MAG: hypothetical protein EHM23_28545 [Acidobacteria bacterium]|nr:MAG: hypothetical protein EHM23_28545 [Acidobacteriota bacterium]